MSKLYTKTGDNGTTSLYDARRVSKNLEIIDALGDIDELSSHIGVLKAHLATFYTMKDGCPYPSKIQVYSSVIAQLEAIQAKLLDIGSCIATTKAKRRTCGVDEKDIQQIENDIDTYSNDVSKLQEFILPGVNITDAQANVCRTVCRRAERSIISIEKSFFVEHHKDYVIPKEILIYVNRLSDFFFALGRALSGDMERRRSSFVK